MSVEIDPNQTGGDGGPHMRAPDPKDYPDRPNAFVKDSQRYAAEKRMFSPPDPLPDAVVGHLTPEALKDGLNVLRNQRPEPDLIADDFTLGEVERQVLADIRANAPAMPPLVCTPQDRPNPLYKMWEETARQAAAAKEQEPFKRVGDILALGGYELQPTEFDTGEPLSIPMKNPKPHEPVILKDRFVCTFTIDTRGVEDAIIKELTPLVGQKLTEEMFKEITTRAGRALNAALQNGLTASHSMPLPKGFDIGEIGYDWKKEQAAIMEEQRLQAEEQQKLQDEMEHARMDDDGGKPGPEDDLRSEYDLTTLTPVPAERVARMAHRRRMRGDAFRKQIIPPIPITGDELDRSVPTNLPVDPTKDTPYQAFRRERHLPDTTEALDQFCKYARMFNQRAKADGTPPIDEYHVTTMEQILMQAQLSAKHIGPLPVRYPLYDQDKKFVGWSDEPNHAGCGYAVPKSPPQDTTEYVKRDGFIQEFFAYETVGMTPAHVASCVKTDDPELMKALGDAIEQGRVVMDGDTIVSIDGVPLGRSKIHF